MSNEPTNWLVLVTSLPTRNATARMRIWRALRGLGCAVLRDGVYLLPQGSEAEQALLQLAEDTKEAGGSAHLLRMGSRDIAQERVFRSLFDRTADYARLVEEIAQARTAGVDSAVTGKLLKTLRREFNAVAATDFFPGEAKALAAAALAELEALLSPGEPRGAEGEVRRLDRMAFQGRRWATRKRPWMDRLASAWLIGRFIDPAARFVWLERPEDCPEDAVGFDFDGADFTHVGNRVTFEVLLASFGLEGDPRLARIAALVHYLDVGGIPVPEAAGLELVLSGARQQCGNDDALLAEAGKTFDFLYSALAEQ
jgi:hypothetical protein